MGEFLRKLPEPVAVDALVARIPQRATVAGAGSRMIRGIAPLSPGQPEALSFCDPGGPADRVRESRSAVIVVAPGAELRATAEQTLIVVEDPRAWFIQAVEALLPAVGRPPEPMVGVHPRASVHRDAQISAGAALGDNVRIGAGTRVGPGAVIYAGSTVGSNCCIGPGTVIGWVGLAYHEDRHGHRLFFPHLGGVRIGDWVDIGANCCVCQGILSDTTIGDQVKIGSLVYVGHGAVIEDQVWISASTAIAGHARIGDSGLIGIGSIVVDNVTTGSGVLVGAGSVVTRNAADGDKLVGVPARHVPTLRRFGPTPRSRDPR
jgi:UDP-3-O-[3-hydroxymyristoyl] glucosamine N-acyltransferase